MSVFSVRILEFQENQPTGREIHMDSDSPLFSMWGDLGKQAIREGSVAIEPGLFTELKDLIERNAQQG